jgi:hypothetical protein
VDDGGDLGAEEFDGAHEFGVGEGGDAHLEGETGDAAEVFVELEDFFDDVGWAADDEGAGGATEGVELPACGGRPAAFFADLGEGAGVAGEEVVGGLGVGIGDVAEGVDADFKLAGVVSGAVTGFAVEVDEGSEAAVFAADDGDHEGKAEGSGAGEGCGCAANGDPDGEGVLDGARVDALAGEGGAMFAGPGDVDVFAEIEEEVEFFGEELVVVFEFEAEEGVGLDEGAAAGDDFCAAVGDEVEGGEVLEDADWVGGAEDGDGGGEADAFGAGGGGGEDDGGGGVEEVGAVVLADTDDVEADLIGVLDLVEEVAHLVDGCGGDVGEGVWNDGGEAVEADLHLAWLLLRSY